MLESLKDAHSPAGNVVCIHNFLVSIGREEVWHVLLNLHEFWELEKKWGIEKNETTSVEEFMEQLADDLLDLGQMMSSVRPNIEEAKA